MERREKMVRTEGDMTYLSRAAASLARGGRIRRTLLGVLCFGAGSAAPAQVVLWEKVGLPGSLFGWRLAGLGDLNGDGVTEVGVGAPWVQGGWTYILSGTDGTTLSYILGPSMPGQHAGLGTYVAAPGDVTGDGVPDILLGSLDLAEARLYSGASGGLVYQWSVSSPSARVGPGADFNGDGTPDLLVGDPLYPGIGVYLGAAYVFSGADGSPLYTFYGASAPELFGTELTALCDVSGDGVPDILVGAPDFPLGITPGTGYSSIFSGANGTLVDQVTPPPGFQLFGGALARFKDVTGDGICDFAVATRNANAGAGQIRVYSGVDRSLVATLDGTYPMGTLGDVIASGGDVDGDGVEDLIAGAVTAPP